MCAGLYKGGGFLQGFMLCGPCGETIPGDPAVSMVES